MYVTEATFDHLRHAADEQRLRELEYRRVARERSIESGPRTGGILRNLVRRFGRRIHTSARPLSNP